MAAVESDEQTYRMEKANDQLFSKMHTLVVRLLEGTLLPAERQELETLLVTNPAARRMYVEHIQEDACLRWLCAEHFADAEPPVLELLAAPDKTRSRRFVAIAAGILASVAVFVVCATFQHSEWRRQAGGRERSGGDDVVKRVRGGQGQTASRCGFEAAPR